MSKLEVARHLLHRAKRALVEDADPLTALVLAGSAEDILQGLVRRSANTRPPAREVLSDVGPELVQRLFPQGAPQLTPEGLIKAMRSPFNWIRHADRQDEPSELDVNWDYEATCALLRGALNHIFLTDSSPFEDAEVVALLWRMAENT